MKIFGISIVTIIIAAVAYYGGTKGWFSAITSKVGA